MKKIPIINYVKVVILFVATVFVVLMLANNYEQKMQYERANDDIMNFLATVKLEELSNYLTENHDGFIYMAPSSNTSFDTFEKDFKNYILDEELEKYFVYIDSSNYSDDTYVEFQKSFFSPDLSEQVSLTNQPNLFAVKDSKVVAVLYTTPTEITLDDVKIFVNMHEVVE